MKTHRIAAALLAAVMLGGCVTAHAPGEAVPAAGQAVPIPPDSPLSDTPRVIPIDSLLSDAMTVRGVVESVTSRNIYTTLNLRVERVEVREGDSVRAGDTLAVLDSQDLALRVAQQRAALDLARQNSRRAISDASRMLNEATENLTNNTNLHILSAEAALSAAETAAETARRNLDDARRDYSLGLNPMVVTAESAVRNARIELDTRESSHQNLQMLYDAGALSRDDLRLSENALTAASNAYNDARVAHENATTSQRRTLEQLETALSSAQTAFQNASDSLTAARVAATQDIERLRSQTASAQVSANLEHMELALQQLENQLSDAVITSPVSGTVTSVVAREGAIAAGVLFVVEDTSDLRIITSFREYDIGNVAEGMTVTITADALPGREYVGVISRLNPAATASSPVVEFEAEVRVTSPGTSLRIGMNTRIAVR